VQDGRRLKQIADALIRIHAPRVQEDRTILGDAMPPADIDRGQIGGRVNPAWQDHGVVNTARRQHLLDVGADRGDQVRAPARGARSAC
jgi:hypothetical protein